MSFALVFIASLLGSPHCAAMCGGFVALSSYDESHRISWVRQLWYHSGRLITYLLLGSIVGALGYSIDRASSSFGVPHGAAAITGFLLIGAGVLRIVSQKSLFTPVFPFLHTLTTRISLDKSRKVLYPLSIGFFSTFLPCGWLYTYLTVAAGTGSLGGALLIMCGFWLGTLPMLMTVGQLSNFLAAPLRRYVPLIASLTMIAAGGFSLYSHIRAGDPDHGSHCSMHEDSH